MRMAKLLNKSQLKMHLNRCRDYYAKATVIMYRKSPIREKEPKAVEENVVIRTA